MEKISNAVYGVVCIVVIVILVATICIPVIEDVQSEQITVGQNTSQKYLSASSNSSVDIEMSIETIDSVITITVNGYSFPATTYEIIAVTDSFLVSASLGNPPVFLLFREGETTVRDSTITIHDNTLTIGETTITYTGTLFYPAANGDYGFFEKNSTVYVNENSEIRAISQTTLTNSELSPTSENILAVCSGTIKDMVVDFGVVTSGNAYTESTVSLSDYVYENEVYELKVITTGASITTSAGTYETITGAVATSILAPIEYTYLSTNDNMIIQLLNILPLLLLLIPVMASVAMITRRD